MQFSRRPGYRPQHETAKTKTLTVNRGSRPRKRPIEVRSLYTKRTTENPSGTDCYIGPSQTKARPYVTKLTVEQANDARTDERIYKQTTNKLKRINKKRIYKVEVLKHHL